MEWFIGILLLAGVLIGLLVVLAFTSKRSGGQVINGHFEFDRYKAGELSDRGIFDKTTWR